MEEGNAMIFILEDDDSIRKLVTYALESQGYAAKGFAAPFEFWKQMEREVPSLLLLDIMLPEEDGISILKKLRGNPLTARLPVIMLTAKTAEYDRVEGLDAGADDYVAKPFGMMELLARVRALLRRAELPEAGGHGSAGNASAADKAAGAHSGVREAAAASAAGGAAGEPVPRIRYGGLCIFPERYEVFADDGRIALTNKEYQLLLLLVENEGIVLTREVLLDRIWDLGAEPENRTLDVHIRKLRAKLGRIGNCIETVRGVGYRFRSEE